MSSGGVIDRILKAFGVNRTQHDWSNKRRSEERDDDQEILKYSRMSDGSLDFGRTLERGNSHQLLHSTKRSSTMSILSKYVGEGQTFTSDRSQRFKKLPLRTDYSTPNVSSIDLECMEQSRRRFTDQALVINPNVEIEISDDEDVTFVPTLKSSNFSNFAFSTLPITISDERKSPMSSSKPIPPLIPRSSLNRIRPIEKHSRFSSNPSPLPRPSLHSRFSLTRMRKSPGISKENRYSRSERMVKSVLKDSYNLSEKKKYKDLLEKLMPSSLKSRPVVLNAKQPKLKIVDTIDLADLEFSDDEVPMCLPKSLPKTPTVLQESTNSSKKTPVLPINSKPITLSSSESTSSVSVPEIEPVNSMLLRVKSSPYFQDDWLPNQNEKCVATNREMKKKIHEVELLSKQFEKIRREAETDVFLKKLNNIAISHTPIVHEISEDEEEFVLPELTQEQLQLVRTVTHRGHLSEVIVSKFNLNIRRQDLCTLVGDAWLNDEVINFYMNLLTERSTKGVKLPKVYAMNTFFAVRLLQAGHSGVKRWTRKVDIFEHDVIPVPVHVSNVHWCMAIIHLKNKTIRYYDSMGQPNMRILDALEQYLKSESLDKKQRPFDMSGWQKECIANAPRQMNGSDCGVFSCMFAEYITRNSEITFTQNDMPYFRQKMIVEIATGRLLL
ncbi:sentrin-specific protease-like [Phlebotomus argentipes]|uniref:sentrin-specific protease-like n=1 Tax=Phlebotomus argentipes TaxID=94469 RepID=UPI0028934DE9|nr:sentrin-specific protease-like [Phlebotomus argentipes]